MYEQNDGTERTGRYFICVADKREDCPSDDQSVRLVGSYRWPRRMQRQLMDLRGLGSRFPSYRTISRVLQVAIGCILVVGIVTVNLSVVVNAAFAFGVTFLPAVLKRDYRIHLDPWMILWITLALFLHTLGMLGFYGEFWWYDHVTHTLSATIVASVGYVTTRGFDKWSDAIDLPSRFMFVFILLFTLGLGVLWEVAEFIAQLGANLLGIESVLISYGLDDTLLDLVFDAVGAVIVAIFGTEPVSDVVDSLAKSLDEYRDRADAPHSAEHGTDNQERFERFVKYEPRNAWISWVFSVFLVAVVVAGITADAVLSSSLAGSVLVLALIPVFAYRTPRAMLPWPLLGIASLPVIGTVFGRPWLTSNLVTYFAVATAALVIVGELHLFMDVKMTPRFAILLVVITTMAATGVWAVGRWLTDIYLGTELLLHPEQSDAAIEAELMWEFVHASVAGLVAGLVFEWGFRRRTD